MSLMPLLADGCRCHDSCCHWSRSSSSLTLSVCVTLRPVVSFIAAPSYDAPVWTVVCCRCPRLRRRVQFKVHDHHRLLARDDEPGNLHAPTPATACPQRRARASSRRRARWPRGLKNRGGDIAARALVAGRFRRHRLLPSATPCTGRPTRTASVSPSSSLMPLPRSRLQVVLRRRPLWTWPTRSSYVLTRPPVPHGIADLLIRPTNQPA